MQRLFANRSRPTLTAKLARVPWSLLAVAAVIASIGALTLYSVAGGSFQPWAERHALRFLMCAAVALGIALVPFSAWVRIAIPIYVAALACLALVPFAGTEVMGAKRWLGAGGFLFQPSELMKVALVLVLARYYQALPPGRVSHPVWVLLPMAMAAVPAALILRQPDLGTALIVGGIGIGVMILAGVSLIYPAVGVGALVAAAPYVWQSLHEYQRKRIEVFLDPAIDPLGAGYHITQSKIALGAGGVSGRGFLKGTQSQLDFLPEKHTDFIFTMIGEEWGFAGTAGLITLFAVLVGLMMVRALAQRSQAGRLAVAGFALLVFLHAFINIAMTMGLVPVVGVPLPLVSYGGTSMLTVMTGLGLAASAIVHAKEPVRHDNYRVFA